MRATPDVADSSLVPESILQSFGAEVEQIFTACPTLEELCFSDCAEVEIVRWERSSQGVISVKEFGGYWEKDTNRIETSL